MSPARSAGARTKNYPAAPLPDDAVGGAIDGVGVTGGTARLLDAETGEPAASVKQGQVDLSRHEDGRCYYLFPRVPEGSYRVEVELVDGRRLLSGLAMPGVEAGDIFAD